MLLVFVLFDFAFSFKWIILMIDVAECSQETYACSSVYLCLESDKVCDLIEDCLNGEDELVDCCKLFKRRPMGTRNR